MILKLDNLGLLFNWFSEGWYEDFQNESEVVQAFVSQSSAEEVNDVILEIYSLLEDGVTEGDLNTIFKQRSCDYSPQRIGLTHKQWLTQIKELIAIEVHNQTNPNNKSKGIVVDHRRNPKNDHRKDHRLILAAQTRSTMFTQEIICLRCNATMIVNVIDGEGRIRHHCQKCFGSLVIETGPEGKIIRIVRVRWNSREDEWEEED